MLTHFTTVHSQRDTSQLPFPAMPNGVSDSSTYLTPMATNSVALGLCSRFPSNSSSKRSAIPSGAGRAYGAPDDPLNLGGNHAVQDNRTNIARRDGTSRLRGRTDHRRSTDNYTNSDRRNQTSDRYRRTASFQSGEHHSSAERKEQRLGGQRHPLPDVRIDRGRARWRGQNAQRRRGTVHRRRKNCSANGGSRRAIDFPPLLPCSRRGLGSACRDGTCRPERIISHCESD